MYQGDQYKIAIALYFDDNTSVKGSDVATAEFVIGHLKKKFPEVVTFDQENNYFLFPISQEESSKLYMSVPAQARVKFLGGDVMGIDLGTVDVKMSLSSDLL